MTFGPFGGAENGTFTGDAQGGGGAYTYVFGSAGGIVSSPALAGAYSYKVDPVGADGLFETYGPSAVLSKPSILTVSFLYRFAAGFDAITSICELGDGLAIGSWARRLVQLDNESFQIQDEDGDSIGAGGGILAVDTLYPVLWYVDLRNADATRDIVWIWKSGAWVNAIDVSGHGDGDPDNIDRITFGSAAGKALPGAGGPFYVDEMAPQILNQSPHTTPIGSVTTRLKMPTANGTDSDFITGTGSNPDWNDVKEIPHDGDTSYDEGDADGEKQSYAIADATGGDVPLAVQINGAAKETAANIELTGYIYDGSTRDYENNAAVLQPSYRNLPPAFGAGGLKTYNQINGAPITEALFNTLEAGQEITTLSGGAKARLTNMGLEYIVPGPYGLPPDFPGSLVVPRRPMKRLVVR